MIIRTDLTGVILAGGQSHRMGQNKALLEYNGQLFIESIIRALKPLVRAIIIIGKVADYQDLGYLVHEDLIPNQGPVGGIYTALHHSKTPYNLVLSCDLPLISTTLLSFLIKQSQTVAINALHLHGKVQPLTAIYHKNCLASFQEALELQKLKLSDLFVPLKTHLIDCPTHFEGNLANINTPEDFEQL